MRMPMVFGSTLTLPTFILIFFLVFFQALLRCYIYRFVLFDRLGLGSGLGLGLGLGLG